MGRQPEVLIIGGGPAGIAAALRLARAQVPVLLLESASFVGAENWSGGVYQAEALISEKVLGRALWDRAPKERRIVARQLLVHDGVQSAGFEARAIAGNDYGEAWTVLRPKLDRYLATCAIELGVTILPSTAVTGFRYRAGRVVGVNTARGPIEVPVVFCAEGDAGQLIAQTDLAVPTAHYAQGIKAVFSLPAAVIEARLGLSAREGLAQEWLLRDGLTAGRPRALHATGFVYTNQESLSVGLVLPLERLAVEGPVDHAQLLDHMLTLPVIRSLLQGAEQVAYGVKVIRSGGLTEGVVPARDGLAVGGAALGLGLEFPYPHFMGPAAASGVAFAEAVLTLLPTHDYSGAALLATYGAYLKELPDYQNAVLQSRWPQALHATPLLFEQLPALIGASAIPPARARALARAGLGFWRDRALLSFRPALSSGSAAFAVPPLAVRWLRSVDESLQPIVLPGWAWARLAYAVGTFYGRAHPLMVDRLRAIASHSPYRAIGKLVVQALPHMVAGAWAFVGDGLTVLVRGRQVLRAKPFYAYEQATVRARLNDQYHRVSPMAWLNPLSRPRPDWRHISVPLTLSVADAERLQRVCPAIVYSKAGTRGGVVFQYENCIKCESCRLVVPTIDWQRTSGHRLIYEVPGGYRFGLDGSAQTLLSMPTPQASGDQAQKVLGHWLRQRPMTTGPLFHDGVAKALTDLRGEEVPIWQRLASQGAFGALQSALGEESPTYPVVVPSEIAPPLAQLGAVFPSERLLAMAQGWSESDRADLLRLLHKRGHAPLAVIEALAEYSPSLGFVAAYHHLAECGHGGRLSTLRITLWATPDGYSQWLPDVGVPWEEGLGGSPPVIVARGVGLDSARPIRVHAPLAAQARIDTDWALTYRALMVGLGRALKARVGVYAQSRIQFAHAFVDREGTDAILKFGAVKRLVALIEYALAVAARLEPVCVRDPLAAIAILKERFGVGLTGSAWVAGQIFGGVGYSEDDVLAPRYRDAMQLMQWPADLPATHRPRDEEALFPDHLTDRAHRLFAHHLASDAPAPLVLSVMPRVRGRHQRPKATVFYDSGQFLWGCLLVNPFIPEYFMTDPLLRQTRAQVLGLLRSGFRSPDGGAYGRFIDTQHGLPIADIERLRAFNAFATVVPEDLGGRGWVKAQYAVLTGLLMGRADTSVGLLVMASTSIGTMPVLLALTYELPRLERELAQDRTHLWSVLERLRQRLLILTERPYPTLIKRTFKHIQQTLQDAFLAPGQALKYLAQEVLLGFQAMGVAARHRDLDALHAATLQWGTQLKALQTLLTDEAHDLPERLRAHRLFLSFLARGDISAFALTEPVAGSDTGAITTRARRLRAALTVDALGLYHFTVDGRLQTLIDQRRLVFMGRTVSYRLANGTLARLDDSAWDMATQTGERRLVTETGDYYCYDDIGLPTIRAEGLVYDYYVLSGAKMWITNGAIADRYCLYAQTELGETGFMVERRSVGLNVGHNEHKLGQQASPTNELSLTGVRVCASHIIGYRGHGQVNALETLSVGRGGLVIGCSALLERLLGDYASLWANHPDAHALAISEYERIRTLAARLIGLMDTADLAYGDFRIEAALSKFLASEGLHRVLRALENIRGPMAASTTELIEKWRRDARILNIYEGTNEIQRFLVLKDIPNLFRKMKMPSTTGMLALDTALTAFRSFIEAHKADLARTREDGDAEIFWFPVVEWLGELYVWCALVERHRTLGTIGAQSAQAVLHDLISEQQKTTMAYAQRVYALVPDAVVYEDAVRTLARLGVEANDPAVPLVVGTVCCSTVVILRAQYIVSDSGVYVQDFDPDDVAVLDQWLAAPRRPQSLLHVLVVTPQPLEDRAKRLVAAGAQVHTLITSGLPVAAEIALYIWKLMPVRVLMGRNDRALAEGLAAHLEAELVTDVTRIGPWGRRGHWIEYGRARRPVSYKRVWVAQVKATVTGRSDIFTITDWLDALKTSVPEQRIAGLAMRPRVLMAPVPVAPAAFGNPAALVAWIRTTIRGSVAAGPLVKSGTVAVGAPVTALVRDGSQARAPAALAAALGINQVVWLMTDRDVPPHVGGVGVCCQAVPRSPVRAWAKAVLPLLTGSTRVVLGASDIKLAATLADLLGWPLIADVRACVAEELSIMVHGRGVSVTCPPRAVLVVSTEWDVFAPVAATIALVETPKPPDAPGAFARAVAAVRVGGLTEAPVIIDVGMGAADATLYQRCILPLQKRLGEILQCPVEIGATRKVVQEAKLLPKRAQIGQTGVRVAPKMLFAIGVSGAPQHLVGVAPVTQIIAINRDAQAPIFQAPAGYLPVIACVGDAHIWLEGMLAALAGP